jgi:hypothetical protein
LVSPLREEQRLRVFENRMLRKVFGPKRDEVTGEWRRIHDKELYGLYPSPDIIWLVNSRRMWCVVHTAASLTVEFLEFFHFSSLSVGLGFNSECSCCITVYESYIFFM